MAIAIANRDQKQATEILSDAIGIALVFGVLFGAATYVLCPSILSAMTGGASSEILAPAISYVQIRFHFATYSFYLQCLLFKSIQGAENQQSIYVLTHGQTV